MIKKHRIAIAACVAELAGGVPTEIMLVPAGEFRARDGRPGDVESWKVDAAAAARLIAQAEAARGDFVIDYEHQTLNAETNGKPAPAAGWFKRLAWREGDGLYATDVRWTERARALIEAGEYRYISPVFGYDRQSGTVTQLLMAALTNYPALDGHSDLAARAAAKFSTTEEEHTMNREELIALLGLAENASDEQIKSAMTALKAKADAAKGKDDEIAALKAAKPDPAKFVPMEIFESLKTEVAALKAQQTSGEVTALVDKGIADGKLLPAQKDWAKELGNKDVAALKGYLEKTPAIAALKGGTQTGGKAPEGGDADSLTEEELAVCRNLGISAEDYRKANPAE
jgi:phage I-like protein